MSVSVEEFMKKNTKPNGTKVSVLKKFEDDIRALLKNGFSTPKIYDFLQQNGVKIEIVTLYQYIARHNLRENTETQQSVKMVKKLTSSLPVVKKSNENRLPEKQMNNKTEQRQPEKEVTTTQATTTARVFVVDEKKTLAELLK